MGKPGGLFRGCNISLRSIYCSTARCRLVRATIVDFKRSAVVVGNGIGFSWPLPGVGKCMERESIPVAHWFTGAGAWICCVGSTETER